MRQAKCREQGAARGHRQMGSPQGLSPLCVFVPAARKSAPNELRGKRTFEMAMPTGERVASGRGDTWPTAFHTVAKR